MGKRKVISEFPELMSQWHTGKNVGIDPKSVTRNSQQKLWWKCNKFEDHEWEISPAYRQNKLKCPFCEGQRIAISNCLATINPVLSKEWNKEKNGELTPFDLSPHSHRRIWWKCDKGHEWEAVCKNRHTYHSKCPYCMGQRATKENCIYILKPEWIHELDNEKNGKLNAYNLCARSNKKVWWKCQSGHKWKEKPDSRYNDKKCPYCSNQKVHTDYCLEKLFPELAKEWHPTKNGTLMPSDVMPSSHTDVWWVCSHGHEWKTSPHMRHKGKDVFSCFECQEVSKGEKKIRELLVSLNIEFKTQYRFKECINKAKLPFDFAIFEFGKISVIEYQGLQHYVPKSFGGKSALKSYYDLKENDTIKREFCKKLNIPYLEIPYWDFEKVEDILKDFIGKII